MINHYFFPNIFPSSIYFPFNKFFTALFIIHPHTPLYYSFKYISNIFFTSFFIYHFLHYIHSYFFKFSSTIFSQILLYQHDFRNNTSPKYTFQIQTNFQTRNLHFEFSHRLLLTIHPLPPVINHPLQKNKKRRIKKKSFFTNFHDAFYDVSPS